MSRRPAPRHKATTKTHQRFAPTVRGMLATSAAVGGASLIAIMAAGGTYALWNGSSKVSSATLTAGTLNLTVDNVASHALSDTPWTDLLPGDSVRQSVTVKNTGTTAATVTTSIGGTPGAFVVTTIKGACPAGAITGTSNLGSFAAGEASLVCIQVALPLTALSTEQGQSRSFSVNFSATTAP